MTIILSDHNQTLDSSVEMKNSSDQPSTSNFRSILKNTSIDCDVMSIKTIKSDESDSSVIDSDLDETFKSEQCSEAQPKTNRISLGHSKDIFEDDSNGHSPMPSAHRKFSVRSISVKDSSDVSFGNKEHYGQPVRVEQYVYDQDKWRRISADEVAAIQNRKKEVSKGYFHFL